MQADRGGERTNAFGELKHALADAPTARDLLGHLDEWRWAITHPGKAAGPAPLEMRRRRQWRIVALY